MKHQTLAVVLPAGLTAFGSQFPFQVTIDGVDGPVSLLTGPGVLALDEEAECQVHYVSKAPSWRPVTLTDPVDEEPHEALLEEPRPLTLQEQIARFIGDAVARSRPDQYETAEEADDLDVDDGDLPLSGYELPYADEEQEPPVKPSEPPKEEPPAEPPAED